MRERSSFAVALRPWPIWYPRWANRCDRRVFSARASKAPGSSGLEKDVLSAPPAAGALLGRGRSAASLECASHAGLAAGRRLLLAEVGLMLHGL